MENLEQSVQNSPRLQLKDFSEFAKYCAPIVVGVASATGLGYLAGGKSGAAVGAVIGLICMSSYYPLDSLGDSCDEAE